MPHYLESMSFQMKRNVDYILNPNHDDSLDIAPPTFKIEDRDMYGYYRIVCKFYGIHHETAEPFEFTPHDIKLFVVNQSFIENFSDDVTIQVEMTPSDFLMLQDNFKELKVLIQLYRCSTKNELYDIAPCLTRKYRAIFKNKSDLRKIVPKESMIPKDPGFKTQGHAEQYIGAEFQLIEDDAYVLRSRRMNLLFRNCKVKDILLQCISIFGIKKISFVEPHNKAEYENIVIPPLLNFEQTFNYINQYFGVYDSGFNFYYTDGILYVYPTYDSEIESPVCANFYNIGETSYEGMELYHAVDTENNYHIVINSQISVKNLQDEVPENVGTHFIALDVDQVIDNTSVMHEGKDVKAARMGLGDLVVTRLKTYMQSSGLDDVGIMFDTYKPSYVFDWNNKYTIPDLLASYRGTLISFDWPCAVPYALHPGYRIKYHYDSEIPSVRNQRDAIGNNYKYETKDGTCLKAVYRMEPILRNAEYQVFGCQGSISCFLVKEKVLNKQDYDKLSKSNPDLGIIRAEALATSNS